MVAEVLEVPRAPIPPISSTVPINTTSNDEIIAFFGVLAWLTGLGGKAVCRAVNIAGLLLESCPLVSRKIIVIDDVQSWMPAWSYGSVNGQAVPFEELSNLLFFWGDPSVVQLSSIDSRAHVSCRPFPPSDLDSWRLVRVTQIMGMSASKPSIAASLLDNSSKSRHLQPWPLPKCAHYPDLAIHSMLAHFDLVLNAKRLIQRKHDQP